MGSAKDLPASVRQLSRSLYRSLCRDRGRPSFSDSMAVRLNLFDCASVRHLRRPLCRARPRPSSSCSGIRGLALDLDSRLSTAPSFRPISTNRRLDFDLVWPAFRLISTFSTENFFRVHFDQFRPATLPLERGQPVPAGSPVGMFLVHQQSTQITIN